MVGQIYGCSSIGRVVVSKTIGWEFESLHPCSEKPFRPMQKLRTYILESTEEMKNKVTWPSYKSLKNSSILVLVASLIFAILIGLMDTVFKHSLEWFYQSL